jgi:ABC-2 type transport system ATP-binding protein
MSLAIQTQHLRKVFRGRAAVEDLSLEVASGEVFGFLGPNGAGKTTTVKMLLGLTHPTGGEVQVLGQSPHDPEARRKIGYLPEMFRFHDWMSGEELLRFHADLYGLSQSEQAGRIPEVLALVGLEGRGKEKIRGYSKGMQQRVGLAQAILHRPKLVFLDEPTSALDPLGRREVREIIAHLKAEGTTVFLNSHLLSEVEQTCDRVAIVNRGRVVRSGRMEELLKGLEVELRVDALSPQLRESLTKLGKLVHSDHQVARLELSSEHDLPQIAQAVHGAGARLYALVPKRLSLEEYFVGLVEGKA